MYVDTRLRFVHTSLKIHNLQTFQYPLATFISETKTSANCESIKTFTITQHLVAFSYHHQSFGYCVQTSIMSDLRSTQDCSNVDTWSIALMNGS